MGMSPYKMVYGKACHLPLELEHKAYWTVRELNCDFKLAGEKKLLDMSSLDEWISEAYENAIKMGGTFYCGRSLSVWCYQD